MSLDFPFVFGVVLQNRWPNELHFNIAHSRCLPGGGTNGCSDTTPANKWLDNSGRHKWVFRHYSGGRHKWVFRHYSGRGTNGCSDNTLEGGTNGCSDTTLEEAQMSVQMLLWREVHQFTYNHDHSPLIYPSSVEVEYINIYACNGENIVISMSLINISETYFTALIW